MEWAAWIPILIVAGFLSAQSMMSRDKKLKSSLCFHYFGIYPVGGLTQVQLLHIKRVLKDLHDDMYECGEVLSRFRIRDAATNGQENLLQISITEAEFEFEKAEFSYSSALNVAMHFAPRGFREQVEEYIHPIEEPEIQLELAA